MGADSFGGNMKETQIEQEHIAFEHAVRLMNSYRAEAKKMRTISFFELGVIIALAFALIAVCVN